MAKSGIEPNRGYGKSGDREAGNGKITGDLARKIFKMGNLTGERVDPKF